jgi:signal peptidase I
MNSIATATGKHLKKLPKRGHIRDNLEAFGVAILAAVLLKYFAIEAYQIPTSSMQPTLMGSTEAGVFDRILVDKLRYTMFEPSRWDVAVFHYPLQKNQNYVKRILGMPGDVLHIGGGNVYQVTGSGDTRSYQVLRKPDRIQERLWKEIYPMRRRVRGDASVLTSFSPSPRDKWSEDGDSLVVDCKERARVFLQDQDGGLKNRVWDGYSLAVSKSMRAMHPQQEVLEIVPNAKFAATLVPEGRLDEFSFVIDVTRRNPLPHYVFALEVTAGQGRLRVYRGSTVDAESQPFPCAVEPGHGTALAFAHRDDELTAWRDGKEVARLDVSKQDCREGCELKDDLDESARVSAKIELKGEGKVRIDDLHIWRDLHYTWRPFLDANNDIHVPPGHYYMMGDNTLQSVDSRGWTAIEVGVMPDGTLVPPTPENKEKGARVLLGNKRPVPTTQPPDRDETPVAIPSLHTIVMIDEFGEIWRLKSDISNAYGSADEKRNPTVMFRPVGAADGRDEWKPRELPVPFVPRGDIAGRALAVFWPLWPFGEQRLGFIR